MNQEAPIAFTTVLQASLYFLLIVDRVVLLTKVFKSVVFTQLVAIHLVTILLDD